jgi:hypothetical protein
MAKKYRGIKLSEQIKKIIDVNEYTIKREKFRSSNTPLILKRRKN